MSLHTLSSKRTLVQRLSLPVHLPAHFNLLATAYGVPAADLMQLAWGLVLRCYFANSSPCWGTIDMVHDGCEEKKSSPTKWETLVLEDSRSTGWILQNWNDPSVHRRSSSEEIPEHVPISFGGMVVLVKDPHDLEVLRDIEHTVGLHSRA